jgi:hypothetical protein
VAIRLAINRGNSHVKRAQVEALATATCSAKTGSLKDEAETADQLE